MKNWTREDILRLAGVVVAFVIGIAGLFFSKTIVVMQPPAQPNFLVYNNSDYPINIKYPKDWNKTEEVELGLKRVKFLPNVSQISQVTVEIEELGKLPTLDDYTNSYINDIIQPKPNDNLQKSDYSLSKGFGYKLVFNKVNEQGVLTKNMTILTLQNGKAYIITYTAEESQYNQYLETAQRMIDSLNE
ncbi:PsbP-related protein [Aerosakkonema funiforme]|uniref:PsbP-related protein n=1 Tax=Aerosakkonema funiforme TaxID=1246630 RepID=UPI0035BA13CB